MTAQAQIDAEEAWQQPPSELGPFELEEGGWGKTARAFLDRARELLRREHQRGASGTEIVRRWTAVVDLVVRGLYDAAHAHYRRRNATLDSSCTLIAQGGYGRGELNPWSDIDLLFLFPQRSDAYVETVTEMVLYALWDTGLTVGQAVRSVRDCVSLAASDFKVKTSLLDTRYLAGDTELYERFASTMEESVLKRSASRFFREKVQENEERHHKHGDAVFLVEPHLKDGEGGLRDIHTAVWLAKVKYKIHDLQDLVVKNVVTQGDLDELEKARDFIWHVRNALHFLSGRHQDQLTFEYQPRIAADLGYRDDAIGRGVEKFMRDYYLYATVVNRFSADMIGRCVEPNRAYRWVGRLASRDIRPGIRIVSEELVIIDPQVIDDDPTLLLRIFADAQRHGVPIANTTRRLIRAKASRIDDRVRRSPEAARSFLDILTWRVSVYDTLQQMHKLDVLDAYLPEFAHLRCLSQYDRYHIYTVDEHILRGVQNLEQLRLGAHKDEMPRLTAVMRDISDVEILYLGMLYHDAGKGRGGDHSNKGAAMVRDVAERLHLSPDAAEQLDFLVRHHLTMHHLATRRDIHDPELVIEFSKTVGSRDNLDKLYVLTYGDLKATNPKLWNNWQAMLLGELYERGVETLEHGDNALPEASDRAARMRARIGEASPDAGPELRRFLADMPDRYFTATTEAQVRRHFDLYRQLGEDDLIAYVEHFREREFSELTVVTRDRPGLFSRITGVLRASGMSIGSALVFSGRDDTALDVIRIPHLDQAEVVCSEERWGRVRSTLREVILEGGDVEALVARSVRPSVLGDQLVPGVPTRVEIDNQVSREFTVIDVYATDRLGILFAIANALFHLGLRIHLAKISTSVDRVLDVFYVTDDANRKVQDAAALERIESGLCHALRSFEQPGDAVVAGAR